MQKQFYRRYAVRLSKCNEVNCFIINFDSYLCGDCCFYLYSILPTFSLYKFALYVLPKSRLRQAVFIRQFRDFSVLIHLSISKYTRLHKIPSYTINTKDIQINTYSISSNRNNINSLFSFVIKIYRLLIGW